MRLESTSDPLAECSQTPKTPQLSAQRSYATPQAKRDLNTMLEETLRDKLVRDMELAEKKLKVDTDAKLEVA